jgi:glucokinase
VADEPGAPTDGDLTIGIDIGGTKVIGGLVDPAGRILDVRRAESPSRKGTAGEVEDTIAGVVTELLAIVPAGATVSAVGIGAAGFVDADRAAVLFAPHLAWRGEPLRDAIADRIALPVVVENDANAAAWAEWRFGAGAGEDNLVAVTLGTGIGGGILLDGRLRRGQWGMAGEFGHMRVVPNGLRCPCGNRGCWEQYASGNALVREARELAASGSPLVADLLERVGGDPHDITGPDVTAAAREGDHTARELLADVGTWLGIGIANLAAALDPGVFVIGGGVSEAGELLLGPARQAFAGQLTGRGHRPVARIVAAQLGARAGLVGAADLARHPT